MKLNDLLDDTKVSVPFTNPYAEKCEEKYYFRNIISLFSRKTDPEF